MSTTSDLANALATVAIAALGGPVPASTAALKELVKIAVNRYQAAAPTRDLQRQVSRAITAWADGERISGSDVDLGLDEAARAVAAFGVSDRESADLGYDAAAAARTVARRASQGDRFWGTEPHHEVAERAITVTYGAMYAQLLADERLLPAILAARAAISDQIDAVGERIESMDTKLDSGLAVLGEIREQVGKLAGPLDAPTSLGGMLRLSWDRGQARELVLRSDDFDVSLGRNASNRIILTDERDSRFHGHLALVGSTLQYEHLGTRPAYLLGATRQLILHKGESCAVADKDRLQFASGVLLVEFTAPDLFDPGALPTDQEDE